MRTSCRERGRFAERRKLLVRAPPFPRCTIRNDSQPSTKPCRLISAAYSTGLHRRLPFELTHLWSLIDIGLITLGVHLMGGIDSPWFIWYLTIWAAVAFCSGERAAYSIVALTVVIYLGSLAVAGRITGWNDTLFSPLFRMAFLVGASFFFLRGIANLREKRAVILEMKEEESRKVEELTRLTAELDRRTRQLAVANRRILEADRMKSRFLANMSHELRTPMNSIIGFSEILIERLDGTTEPKHVEFQRNILSAGQHLLNIINDILDLSKIEAGKIGIYPERFPVRPVVENVCQVMRGCSG